MPLAGHVDQGLSQLGQAEERDGERARGDEGGDDLGAGRREDRFGCGRSWWLVPW
jgi:hypothetical protein